MVAYFFYGLSLGLPAAAQPGPFQAYLINQTLSRGWYRTLPAAFAPLISDGPIIILTTLILSQTPTSLLTLLRLIGGVFMLYLAYLARPTTVPPSPATPEPIPPLTTNTTLAHAALMNFLNPIPYLFWSTVAGPILITAWRQTPLHATTFLLGFYGTLITGFTLFIALIATLGHLDHRLNQLLTTLSALALALLGLYQLFIATNSLFS
ncbi:MAG TPA: LysE family transporter [Anaerolineae bacterium]|nr:LysE family transporter [Anaerolineae bacterium]